MVTVQLRVDSAYHRSSDNWSAGHLQGHYGSRWHPDTLLRHLVSMTGTSIQRHNDTVYVVNSR